MPEIKNDGTLKSHGGGRPTKYNQGILDKTTDYLKNFKETYGDIVPTIQGLTLLLKVSDETISNWKKDDNKKEFFGMLEELKKRQHQALLNGGISGDFNSNITKLVLTKHGYSDKHDSTLSSPGGGPVEIKTTEFTLVKSETKK